MRPSESADSDASKVTLPSACEEVSAASGLTLLGVSVGRGASDGWSSCAIANGIAGTSRAVPNAQAAATRRVLLTRPTLTHNLRRVTTRGAIRRFAVFGGLALLAGLAGASPAAAEPEFLRTWGHIGTAPG